MLSILWNAQMTLFSFTLCDIHLNHRISLYVSKCFGIGLVCTFKEALTFSEEQMTNHRLKCWSHGTQSIKYWIN